MPVKVACSCGQSFTAKDELVGQTLLCPKCHQPLTIGATGADSGKQNKGGQIEELFDDIGLTEKTGPQCPQCSEPVLPEAILCVSCGYNLQTGEKVKGAKIHSSERASVTEFMLTEAEQRIADEKLEDKKQRAQGAPIWLLFTALALVLGFTATMYLLPRERAFFLTGNAIFILAGIVQAIAMIRIYIVAFKESNLQGFLCLLIPFYALIYVFMHWSQCGKFFLAQLAAGAAQGLGFGMVAIAPMLKAKEENAFLPLAPPRIEVVRYDSDASWYAPFAKEKEV